jgi:hypothetical protein
LDSAVEHLVAANKYSLFALNHHCAKLRIMDVKLHCDLFNMLVRSTSTFHLMDSLVPNGHKIVNINKYILYILAW